MRKLWWFFLMFASPALAQNSAVTGFCTAGSTQALLSGIKSNNFLQGIIPRCTVTVVLTGTQTPATIYSSAGGAQLDNPFTANQNGQWLFYAASVQYDVILSGGTPPNVYVTPIKLTGLGASGGGGGGGGAFTMNYKGLYSNLISYAVNDVIADASGHKWISLASSNLNNTPAENSFWTAIAGPVTTLVTHPTLGDACFQVSGTLIISADGWLSFCIGGVYVAPTLLH